MAAKAYVAKDADIIGNVILEENSSVWYHAVLRAECEGISVGKRSNLQDGCIVHTDPGYPVCVGENVTVGHRAILHGCTVGNGALIGMGAIVMNGAVIGENAVVAAGAVVTEHMEIPAGAVVMGMPAKVRRSVSEEDIAHMLDVAEEYTELARAQLEATTVKVLASKEQNRVNWAMKETFFRF